MAETSTRGNVPKIAREASAVEVRRMKPGLHTVGVVPGLMLQVAPTGARSWVLRATVGDRRRDIGLGGFPGVTLQDARDRAREARDLIRKGEDPVQARKAAKAALMSQRAKSLTFDEAADRFLANKLHEFGVTPEPGHVILSGSFMNFPVWTQRSTSWERESSLLT